MSFDGKKIIYILVVIAVVILMSIIGVLGQNVVKSDTPDPDVVQIGKTFVDLDGDGDIDLIKSAYVVFNDEVSNPPIAPVPGQ